MGSSLRISDTAHGTNRLLWQDDCASGDNYCACIGDPLTLGRFCEQLSPRSWRSSKRTTPLADIEEGRQAYCRGVLAKVYLVAVRKGFSVDRRSQPGSKSSISSPKVVRMLTDSLPVYILPYRLIPRPHRAPQPVQPEPNRPNIEKLRQIS